MRKKETEDSEEFANGKVVHSQEATSNESQPPVKKKVKKKKKTKRKKRKKGNTTSNIPIAQQNLAGLVIFIAALLIVFSLFFISPWSKQKVLTVSGTKNALPEDVKVASGILDTDYITHVFFNQGKIASTVEKTNVWVKKATVTYSFPNQFNIAVKEGADNEVANDFITYIMSTEGQKIVADNGYIPVADTKAYDGTKPSGSAVVGGSSSVSPVMEKLIEAYKSVNPNAKIELQTSDSTTGMTSTLEGSYDIGMASRELKEEEVGQGLKATVIATDGIAVIVNNDNPTEELSSDQVKSIYTGETYTWDEVTE